jgi:hypothetical protein
MLKKFLMGAAMSALLAGSADASNIPLVSGPQDPANNISLLNQTIQGFNFGVTGVLSTLLAAVTSSGTAITPLFTYVAPGGQLSVAGQLLHVKAWGTNSADANVKTVTFAYGAATCAQIVTGSGNSWVADFWVLKTAAAAQTYMCVGQTATTNIAPTEGTATNTDASATTVLVEATAATSGTITLAGAYVEQLK